MYIKRYTISVMIFMVIVGWYIYAFVTQQSVGMDLFGIHMPSLPVAFWAVVPIFLLYLASVAHMSYYSLIGSLKLRKYQKDADKLIDAFCDAYLGKENRLHDFKTQRYSLLGKLIDNSAVTPSKELSEVGNDKIDAVLSLIQTVNDGKSTELKKYHLGKNNPIEIQNQVNRFSAGELSAEEILSHSDRYSGSLCRDAYIKLAAAAPLYALEKYKSFMSKEALFVILGRINALEHTLEASNESLIALFEQVTLSEDDYIQMAIALSAHMVPDQRIRLFEALCEKSEDAISSYLYTLFDLEMVAPAYEILENSQPDEFVYFKAYRALKECNKPYSIDLFMKKRSAFYQ